MKSFTKTVTKTYTPIWVHTDFTLYDEEYIEIRSNHSYKANSCFKCNKKFKLNEQIGLACFAEVGNKVLCQFCAEELLYEYETVSI